jgi:hypothetical protein
MPRPGPCVTARDKARTWTRTRCPDHGLYRFRRFLVGMPSEILHFLTRYRYSTVVGVMQRLAMAAPKIDGKTSRGTGVDLMSGLESRGSLLFFEQLATHEGQPVAIYSQPGEGGRGDNVGEWQDLLGETKPANREQDAIRDLTGRASCYFRRGNSILGMLLVLMPHAITTSLAHVC